jgi:hypothetical protein
MSRTLDADALYCDISDVILCECLTGIITAKSTELCLLEKLNVAHLVNMQGVSKRGLQL